MVKKTNKIYLSVILGILLSVGMLPVIVSASSHWWEYIPFLQGRSNSYDVVWHGPYKDGNLFVSVNRDPEYNQGYNPINNGYSGWGWGNYESRSRRNYNSGSLRYNVDNYHRNSYRNDYPYYRNYYPNYGYRNYYEPEPYYNRWRYNDGYYSGNVGRDYNHENYDNRNYGGYGGIGTGGSFGIYRKNYFGSW